MEVKLFELRDEATHIPLLAVRMLPANLREQYILQRAGYHHFDTPLVMITAAYGGCRAEWDPYAWGAWGSRTYRCAHEYITSNWAGLSSGDVVDVRFILGETTKPAESEQWTSTLPTKEDK